MPVCSLRSPRVCCPGARRGRSPCCGPGSIRCARSSRRSRRAARSRPAGRGGRSVRGGCSRPAATRRSARPSSTRSWPRCETRAGVRWWSSAVRADFYGRCAAYTELSRLLGAGHALVGPMLREELRRAIELPARRAGLLVERELVDALVADVQGAARCAAAGLVGVAGAVAAPRRRFAALVRLRAGRGSARGGRATGRAGLRAARPRRPAAGPAGPAAAGRGGRGRRRRAAPRPARPSSRAPRSRMSWTCSPRRG